MTDEAKRAPSSSLLKVNDRRGQEYSSSLPPLFVMTDEAKSTPPSPSSPVITDEAKRAPLLFFPSSLNNRRGLDSSSLSFSLRIILMLKRRMREARPVQDGHLGELVHLPVPGTPVLLPGTPTCPTPRSSSVPLHQSV